MAGLAIDGVKMKTHSSHWYRKLHQPIRTVLAGTWEKAEEVIVEALEADFLKWGCPRASWERAVEKVRAEYRTERRHMVVEIFYPNVGTPDHMSKAEFFKYNDCDFPNGTTIRMGGIEWIIESAIK